MRWISAIVVLLGVGLFGIGFYLFYSLGIEREADLAMPVQRVSRIERGQFDVINQQRVLRWRIAAVLCCSGLLISLSPLVVRFEPRQS